MATRGRTIKALVVAPVAAAVALSVTGPGVTGVSSARTALTSPIKHVVYILQENHSFDNVLGAWCHQTGRCDGAITGQLSKGQVIPLTQAADLVPKVAHLVEDQLVAVNGGQMNSFNEIAGCTKKNHYQCYSQFSPNQIPNTIGLASAFAVSDRTFQTSLVPSWGSHLQTVAATLDGFTGDIPKLGARRPGPGWGCDSNLVTTWTNPATGRNETVPACIPKPNGSGPFQPSPVKYVPTIMDRLEQAGLSWKLYTGQQSKGNKTGWGWAICPSFANCIYTPQAQKRVDNSQVLTDARLGTLPNFSVVTPNQVQSQHNNDSMALGDNWIGTVLQAIELGPDWNSTAVFLGWDDCGCFYDHVAPPAGLGIRSPMVIISPYIHPGFTDHNVASYASVLAFTETVYQLTPLGVDDRNAYNYMGAFNLAQAPLAPTFHMTTTAIPAAEQAQIAANPPDAGDPT